MNKKLNPDGLDTSITLTADDGKKMNFQILDLISYNDRYYAALLPTKGSRKITFFDVEETDNSREEIYTPVNDPDTMNELFGIFSEKFKDKYIFGKKKDKKSK